MAHFSDIEFKVEIGSDDMPARYYDNDADLLDVLEALWANKFTILMATILPLVASWGVLLATTPAFEVKAPYLIKIAPLSTRFCVKKVGTLDEQCAKDIVSELAEALSRGEWLSTDGGSALSHTTKAPKSLAEYQNDLEELNQILRSDMLAEAKTEVQVIDNGMDTDSRQTEVVASSLLQAKRIIFSLEGGSAPLAFGPVSIGELKQNLIIMSLGAAVAGALAGSIFVLLRKAFRDRRLTTM